MTRYPNLTTWVLAAAAAGALLLPGAWALLALVPLAIVTGAACARPRARHAAPPPPACVPATITQLWLYGPHSAAGSMDLTAELAWRRRYDIPPGLSVHTMEAGSGPPRGAPTPRPYLVAFDPRPPAGREQLERLASTGEHTGLARQLEYRADLEAQDEDRAAYLRGLADRAAAIRQAALEGLQ